MNSLLTGKNTGNFSILSRCSSGEFLLPLNPQEFLYPLPELGAATEQGIINAGTGNYQAQIRESIISVPWYSLSFELPHTSDRIP